MNLQQFKWAGACVMLLLAGMGHRASGQYVVQGGTYPYGWGWGGGGTTAYEANARGTAELIRANSQARIDAAQAKNQELQNRQVAAENYFARKRMNQAFMAEKEANKTKLSADDVKKYNAALKPPRLLTSQLDPTTGKIHWPFLLMDVRFESFRKPLDKLFEQRAEVGMLSPSHYSEVQATTESMLAELRKVIREVASGDYMAARQFIMSLASEARFGAS